MAIVKKRQMEFFGNVMKKEGLDNLAVTGMVEEKKSRDKQI